MGTMGGYLTEKICKHDKSSLTIIPLMLQCCSSEKKIGKTFKNCFSSALFRQKQGQHGPHPKSNSNFSEVTKKW